MSRTNFVGNGYALKVVERKAARRLVTIPPDHVYWSMQPGLYAFPEDVTGAIVRVQPPPGATDEQVRALQESFAAVEVARVKVQPWNRAKEEPIVRTTHVHEGANAREIVQQMGRASPRAAELEPLLDELLSKQGL
jgi:hypothetical protein